MLAGCGCSHKPQYLLDQYTQPVERRCFFSVVSQMLLLHFEEHWIIKSLHWPLMLHRTRMRFDRVRSCHLTILRSRISCCNESVTFRSSLNSTSSVTFISVDWKRSRRKYGGKRSAFAQELFDLRHTPFQTALHIFVLSGLRPTCEPVLFNSVTEIRSAGLLCNICRVSSSTFACSFGLE
jgi:hypothetical protein